MTVMDPDANSKPKPRSKTAQNSSKGGKGGSARKNGAASAKDSLSPQQRAALKEVRSVMKDQATDEQILSMLNDFNNDSKIVIQHIVENGPNDGWSDVSSKSKKRQQHAEESSSSRDNGHYDRRDDRRGGKGAAKAPASVPKARDANDSGRNNTRPAPKAQGGAKLPAPAPAPQPASTGKSWASMARGQAEVPIPAPAPAPAPAPVDTAWPAPTLSPVVDNSSGWGGDEPIPDTGVPLFDQMMQQAQVQRDANPDMPVSSMPLPPPKPQEAMPSPQPMPQQPAPAAQQLFESQVRSNTPPAIQGVPEHAMNHHVQLVQNMLHLWDNRLLCDLRLIPAAEGKQNDVCISVHSSVIAAASEEIRKILVNCLQNNGALPPDLVVHVETTALEELVRYMYTGELRIHDDSVSNIMHAAETLGVVTATSLCVEFLGRNITATNALSVSDIAIRFNRPELKQSVEFYLLKNIQHLVQESDFFEQPLERVKELLGSDDANFHSEVDVFTAVCRWVRHDLRAREQHFALLMAETVRLPLMTAEQLYDEVDTEELVKQDRAAQDLLAAAFRYHALPESRKHTMQIRGTQMRRLVSQPAVPGYY